jgi:hypothetical protein
VHNERTWKDPFCKIIQELYQPEKYYYFNIDFFSQDQPGSWRLPARLNDFVTSLIAVTAVVSMQATEGSAAISSPHGCPVNAFLPESWQVDGSIEGKWNDHLDGS